MCSPALIGIDIDIDIDIDEPKYGRWQLDWPSNLAQTYKITYFHWL